MNQRSSTGLYIFVVVAIALVVGLFVQGAFKNAPSFETAMTKDSDAKKMAMERVDKEFDYSENKDVSVLFKKDMPLDQPNISDIHLVTWAAMASADIMTFGFNDYKTRLDGSSRYFTDGGYVSFSGAMKRSRILEMIEANQQTVHAVPTGAPTLLSRGVDDGVYLWVYRIPIVLTYRQGNRSRNDNMDVTAYIVRSDDPKHPYGVAIKQWVATMR